DHGPGTVPEPEVLEIAELGEAWEGVLVQVENVAVSAVGSFNLFSLTDGLETVAVTTMLHYYTGWPPAVGKPFTRVTGPVTHEFNEYRIAVRRDDDLEEPQAVAVSAGGTFTCASDAGGRVWCWGADSKGQSSPPPGLAAV